MWWNSVKHIIIMFLKRFYASVYSICSRLMFNSQTPLQFSIIYMKLVINLIVLSEICRFTLKPLFNNVFTLEKSELHVSKHAISISVLIRCKNEALKKLHLKGTIKCFKEVKIDKWPDLSHSFLAIDCCVRINGKPVYSMVIFSHRYIDSDHINFKTFVFLAVYWSIWTSSYYTDIKVQQFFKWSLYNVKQCL